MNLEWHPKFLLGKIWLLKLVSGKPIGFRWGWTSGLSPSPCRLRSWAPNPYTFITGYQFFGSWCVRQEKVHYTPTLMFSYMLKD